MNNLAPRALLLPLLFASLVGAQDVTTRYAIQYTGRTLGYARVPDVQTVNTPPPHGAPASRAKSYAAESYATLFARSNTDGPTLRLGMGDNFAPNLLARTYRVPSGKALGRWCPADVLVPKDRFYFDTKPGSPTFHQWLCADADKGPGEDPGGNTAIDYDNVAQFFIAAKYNALVPGKHDFYFGAERLRDLARLLADNNVHMLGANLAVSTTKAPTALDTYPRIPNRYAGLRYGTNFGPVSVDLPEMVFPYKRQFVIKNARQVLFRNGNGLVPPAQLATLMRKDINVNPLVVSASICREMSSAVRDPRNIPLPNAEQGNCMALVPAEAACAAGRVLPHLQSSCRAIYKDRRENGEFDANANPSHPRPDETYLFARESDQLSPGLNYLFCMSLSGVARDQWTCQPFSVQMPFFTLGTVPRDPTDRRPDVRMPFELVDMGSLRIAVFGVVDPDLLSNVGLINYAWLNDRKRLDTVVKVAPADYTLQQSLDLCNSRDECRTARKIVMAQMSWAKAGQLISRFGEQFDLAISQSDDDHDTGNREVTGSIPAKPGARLLITPPNPATPDAGFIPKLSSATVSIIEAASGNETRVSWKLHNIVDSDNPIPDVPGEPMCVSPSCITVTNASHAALGTAKAAVANPVPQPLAAAPSDNVRDLALLAMRRYKRTDIAFLQKRDLYDADNLSSSPIFKPELQNQLHRIFWKGDFVTELHATGATLRKIMKQSKKFADLDHDSLSTEVEHGRDLVALGLQSDPLDSDTMYVNGTALDDASLYSVAATQYLAMGDTGYIDLATPDVPPPSRIEDFEKLRSIAGLVCGAIEETNIYPGIKCDKAVLDKRYLDPSSARPFDETSGFDAGSHFTTFRRRLTTDGSVPTSGVKGSAQQRGFLAVNLENLDLAYGGTYVNHVRSAGNTFAGITAPGVTTTGNNSLGADHRLREIYDFRRGTFYALSDSSCVRTSTTTSVVPTITSNMVGFEGGGTIRLLLPRRPSWVSLQYASRFEGQLTDPSPIKVSTNLFLPAPQISTVSGRLGLRLDHADTYLETGFEEVDSRHILSQYQFADGTTCSPSPMLQLACSNSSGMLVAISSPSLTLSSPSPPKVATADYLTSGVYLNFNIKFPLWSRRDAGRVDRSWYFTLTNRGDLYFNSPNDTATQTRYLDKFKPSFSIPIYGKLALSPKVDFIFYENKVFRNHYRAVVPSLSLSYTFKWREGMDLGRALGYGGITTTPSTAGSLVQK
jgi:hypothetical protein